jgi:predicted 3-demethylubiquinone-9 3-methyltransferase (glyoxalase superfamily)
MAAGDDEAKRVFQAMMTMQKIDIATIDAARRG